MTLTTIRGLGTSVEVELGDAIDPAEFAVAWSRCLVPAGSVHQHAHAGDDPVGPQPSMSSLTQVITRSLIERRAGELLMLHAGAVCNPRTGDALAYAAPGGTGKTTLTRLLGRRYGYLTDETVGIDPESARICPYEKPLSMRTADGGYPKREAGPDELGLQAAHPQPRLTTLAILRRSLETTSSTVTRLDLLDAITMLVPETSSLPRLPRPLHLLADLYASLGGIWLLEYCDAEHLVGWVGTRLGEP